MFFKDKINWMKWGKAIVVLIPLLWLLLFVFFPFLNVFKISFSEPQVGMPPYASIFTFLENQVVQLRLTLENYTLIFTDIIYRYSLINSLFIASTATFICLLLGYPMAYYIAQQEETRQTHFLLLVVLPFWTSFLLRVYAWVGILSAKGFVNNILIKLGFIDSPLPLLYSNFGVLVGMVYCYLPFMILPLFSSLAKFDVQLLEAAADLGARPIKTFLRITLPLTKAGIFSGCILVFIPAVGEFVIPELLGNNKTLMLGKLIWIEFFSNRDWPVASAIAVIMLIVFIIPVIVLQKRVLK
jgi:putrescine transport system permease protein